MSRKQLMLEMDAQEVLMWMAYETSVTPEHQDRYIAEIENERMKLMDDEARSQAIKDIFNFASGQK